MAVLLTAAWSHAATAAAPGEYQLKAAFLLSFVKFVEWPETAFRSSESALLICVVGEDPFGRDLDEMVKGQTIGERTIAIKRTAQISREDSCQVAFVSSGEGDKWQRSLAALRGAPTLTVVENDEVVDNSVINLLVDDRKIRFGVNMGAADRAGLKISSKLLKLAKSIRERRKG
jgi:hypothetical protein